MKILAFCFYFPPDLSAGAFRATSLMDALSQHAEVEVLTSQPNRYASHAVEAPAEERRHDNLLIRRFAVPAHSGGMASQIRTFLPFAFGARRHARKAEFDAVFATTSRLFTALLAATVAARAGKPLYLDVRDIFVDTMKDVLNPRLFRLLSPVLRACERYTIRRASVINLVSPGFLPYFRERYPDKKFELFTNGIDPLFLEASEAVKPMPADGASHAGRPRILYAGNVGEGQGIHHILPLAAAELRDEADFVIYGDGGRMPQLREACARLDLTNVHIHPPVPRAELLDAYHRADALLVHLNAYDAFLKVLPSKLFEYGSIGRPIIAGLGGVAADFVRTELPDSAVFPPQDVAGLVAAVRGLPARPPVPDRTGFIARYRRTEISRAMAASIAATARGD